MLYMHVYIYETNTDSHKPIHEENLWNASE